MNSYRFFVRGFMLVTVLGGTIANPVYAQPAANAVPREVRANGVSITLLVDGNHVWYDENNNCPAHKTSKGRSFEHNLVIVPKLEGWLNTAGTGWILVTFTLADVKSHWDNYFVGEAANRENVVSYGSDGGEDLTYNCYGFAFGYDCWVQDPDRIYEDGYVSTSSPSEGDVIRQGSHVISITSINHCESPYLVIGTSEKMRHSGIYHFLYEYSGGLGDDSYKNYYTPKPVIILNRNLTRGDASAFVNSTYKAQEVLLAPLHLLCCTSRVQELFRNIR